MCFLLHLGSLQAKAKAPGWEGREAGWCVTKTEIVGVQGQARLIPGSDVLVGRCSVQMVLGGDA